MTVLACCLMGSGATHASAQEADSTTTAKKTPKGFNALEYVNQGIWRGNNLPFSNKQWHDNIYIFAGVGAEGLSNNKLDLSLGTMTYVGIGKDVTKNHTLRLAFDYTNNRRTIGDPLDRWGVSLAHLFNISGYTMGYDPNRRIEFSTLVGGGYQHSDLGSKSASGFRGWVGFQAKFHAQRHIDLALEPFLGISTYKLMMAERPDRLYQLTYGASFNVRYKWHHDQFEYHNRASHLIYGNFYSASMGAAMPISDLEGFGVGPTAAIGLGRWMVPGLGVKLTFTGANMTWHKADYSAEVTEDKPYVRNENTSYLGGRLELVWEPTIFFHRYNEYKNFQLRFLAGGEFGYMEKKNYNRPITGMYGGPTAAIQFAYRCEEDKLLYIEPRFTMANYQVPYERIKAYKHFADNMISLNVGMEVNEPVISRRKVNAYLRPYFRKMLLFNLEGGINVPIFPTHYAKNIKPGTYLGLIAHYHLTPEHGFAVHADYNHLNLDMEKGKQSVHLVSLTHQYRLDATNAILGYDPKRRYHLAVFAGPTVSYRVKLDSNQSDKIYVGAETGFQIKYNFTEYFGFYLSPQIKLYPTDILQNGSDGLDRIVNIAAGVQFKL
ncbi:MAG: hypothetical protein Q4B58_00630 [Bacteroidales bacterium]|nr:hypothetical protein [Bacteroidales bacterium]